MALELFAEQALQYDSSIDVFALGLAHMVVLNYNEEYPVGTPHSSEPFLHTFTARVIRLQFTI